jgi:probable FeS assembly SUF system protein SufT
METDAPITLKRDCEAVMIPSGTPLLLKAGDQASITQSLGGSYTVYSNGLLARIEGKDADALGLETAVSSEIEKDAKPAAGPVNEELIWKQMRTCFDPEIPVNIVDLGLIYDCCINPLPDGGNLVLVKMTLTAPGCGMSEFLKADLEAKIRNVPGVTDVQVEVVWEPPWNQGMISESARLELGLM